MSFIAQTLSQFFSSWCFLDGSTARMNSLASAFFEWSLLYPPFSEKIVILPDKPRTILAEVQTSPLSRALYGVLLRVGPDIQHDFYYQDSGPAS